MGTTVAKQRIFTCEIKTEFLPGDGKENSIQKKEYF